MEVIMMKMIIASILTFFLLADKKCPFYRSLTVLLLVGCLMVLSACAPRQLTPAQQSKFDQAIQADPNNALNYFRRGHAYFQIGQYQSAIEDYSRAIELDPSDARVYNSRGVSYDKLRQFERAVEDYSRAIKLDPNYASPYYNRGNVWGRLGKRAQACIDMRKACELFTKQGQRERAKDACYSAKRNCT
jgi:tetratricopeptide (TPR) repeat protein